MRAVASGVPQILTAASVQFLKGGPKRLVHTIPPLVFAALQVLCGATRHPSLLVPCCPF